MGSDARIRTAKQYTVNMSDSIYYWLKQRIRKSRYDINDLIIQAIINGEREISNPHFKMTLTEICGKSFHWTIINIVETPEFL